MRGASIAKLGLVASLACGCAGGAAAPAGNETGAGPLADGVHLSASLEIPAGTTVTIPAGAKIVAATGVFVTVRGVLAIASADAHARIAAAGSDPWGGLVVESGGRLDADGLDLAGATTALDIKAGSLGARYDHGAITDAQVPFQVDTGGRLDTAHAAVTNPSAASGINGEFHASYLDYETTAVAGGLITSDPSAIFDATDSTFHAAFISGGDFITSYASALVHVAYSTVADAHCAFHFDDVARFEIDHVTAGAASPATSATAVPLVFYGAMLYGSGAGPNVISNSNFMGDSFALDQENANGALTITNTFTKGPNTTLPTTTWLPTDVAAAPIADAKPR